MPAWFPDWSGEVCAIIASGQTVSQCDVDLLRGRCKVIVVNNNYQLAPWADALYAADGKWWNEYPDAVNFAGLKITRDHNICSYYGLHEIELIEEADASKSIFSVTTKGVLARGGNSGFQAINLAIQFGAKRHIWIGFDFYGEHWHGKHPAKLANPRINTLARWARTLDNQVQVLAELGVSVINCSPNSVLKSYPKMDVASALDSFTEAPLYATG